MIIIIGMLIERLYLKSQKEILLFDEKRKLVIQEALDKFEEENNNKDIKATIISKRLKEVFGENWSIVVYGKYLEEKGYVNSFHYKNKWWIYGVAITDISGKQEEIKKFMDKKIWMGKNFRFKSNSKTCRKKN